jgi:hypothetical protein
MMSAAGCCSWSASVRQTAARLSAHRSAMLTHGGTATMTRRLKRVLSLANLQQPTCKQPTYKQPTAARHDLTFAAKRG